MRRSLFLSIALIVAFSQGCNSSKDIDFEDDTGFPAVKNLSEYQETLFLPSLETSFDSKFNGVYAASLGMAWDEIRNEIGSPVQSFSNKDLEVLNNSECHKKVLTENEYTSSVEVDGLTIKAKAAFRKMLPFRVPLRLDREPLLFLDQGVSAFGFSGHNSIGRILYYTNDDDFAIVLQPKDPDHEIILIKSTFSPEIQLNNEFIALKNRVDAFNGSKNSANRWKYHFNPEDIVSIPVLGFNIAHNYSDMEGSTFESDASTFTIERAYQRTAFVLNEEGAKVESEAAMEASEEAIEEMPKPKALLFNKPFMVLLKRKDSQYPYFALYSQNTELMTRR